MCRSTKLHSTLLAATLLVVLRSANCALAQSSPVSSDRPWHSPAERNVEADLRGIPDSRFTIESAKTYAAWVILFIASEKLALTETWSAAAATILKL